MVFQSVEVEGVAQELPDPDVLVAVDARDIGARVAAAARSKSAPGGISSEIVGLSTRLLQTETSTDARQWRRMAAHLMSRVRGSKPPVAASAMTRRRGTEQVDPRRPTPEADGHRHVASEPARELRVLLQRGGDLTFGLARMVGAGWRDEARGG